VAAKRRRDGFYRPTFWRSIIAPPAQGRSGSDTIAFDIIVVCQATVGIMLRMMENLQCRKAA
jgi:hypothetical protein